MEKFSKKITAAIIMLAIIVFMLSYAAFASYDVTVMIDGEKLSCSQSPVIYDGVTYVPLRDIFEKMGAEVVWNEESRTALVNFRGKEFVTSPDTGIIKKQDENKSAQIITVNDRIMVPLRFVAEGADCSVMWRAEDYTVSISTQGLLRVYFLDCGQADSFFIELPDGKAMLIDAGESSFGKELESFIRVKGYSHIDYVVATHPHSDHIGGMAHILKSFTVGKFYMPEANHTTKAYENMLDALAQNGCEREYILRGDAISVGIYDINVLSPIQKNYIKLNNYSAVLRLRYKDVSILFSADAEAVAEEDMVDAALDLKSDILKVGHHGSTTSSAERYLDAVSPSDAVITAKKDEKDHPSDFVLKLLESRNIKIHRTDTDGTVTATTDGYIYIIE